MPKNGLFWTMDSARENTIYQFRFLGTSLYESTLMFSEANNNWKTIYFYMYDVEVSPGLCGQQMNKATGADAPSYSYSEANITKWITNRSVSADPKPALSDADVAARQDYLDGLIRRGAPNYPDIYESSETTTAAEAKTLSYYQSWNNELNRIYALLEKKLPAAQMEKLRQDERKWMIVRDKNAAQAKKYLRGGMFSAKADKNRALGDLTQNRTFYLINLYFGDSSQPTTTDIVNRYGLKK
ncbi:MAG: DUF1311 domain-containing protein [Coriobacteriia bacterium]|nr:DUF1311 domain-containing protein [Coriobacteriia bacterium]